MERVISYKVDFYLKLFEVFVKNEMYLEWKCCSANHLYIGPKLFNYLYAL